MYIITYPTGGIPFYSLLFSFSGGGIGGLTLALMLKKFAHDKQVVVDLYEANAAFTEIGAGINVWHRPRHILRQLGLDEGLAKSSISPTMRIRKSDAPEGYPFHELRAPGKPLEISASTTTLNYFGNRKR